jgi:hypothetical protein
MEYLRGSSLALGLFAFPQYARSAPQAEASAIANDIAISCKEDRLKFCADVEPGGGRIKACYEAHKAELSKPCQKARAAARAAENATK